MARHRNSTSSRPSSKSSTSGSQRHSESSGTTPRSRSGSRVSKRSFSSVSGTSTIFNFFNNTNEIRPVRSNSRSDACASNKNRFSLYKLLCIELNINHHDSSEDEPINAEIDHSYEELVNMMKIPFYLERFMMFGLLVCVNSFLTLFTLAPLKILVVAYATIVDLYRHFTNRKISESVRSILSRRFLIVKKDIITLTIVSFSIVVLSSKSLDISRMYHEVRGETHIKLYVMFGVLEVAEKLCSSLGQDILNILYNIPLDSKGSQIPKFAVFFLLSIIYLSLHAYILISQTVSLNVAANSYSNALMTLLLSNQFSELKSSVFKKSDREGLFQIAMADLTERFQLLFMLGIIALRNLLQLNSNHIGLIPNSWKSWNTWFGAIFGPGIVVIGSEILVDWLKHCYISKFNKVRPRVYRNFVYVLSLDFLQVFKLGPNNQLEANDLTDYIVLTRRIGLPLLASVVCSLRMTMSDLKRVFVFPIVASYTYSILASGALIVATFLTLILIRLILGLVILKMASSTKAEHIAFQEELKRKAIEKQNAEALVLTPEASPKLDPVHFKKEVFIPSTPLDTPIKTPEDTLVESKTISGDNIPEIESPISAINSISYFPGNPNSEASSINPKTRSYLYDYGEEVPPTVEEKRNEKQSLSPKKDQVGDNDTLHNVMRYKMSSKRIW
ncbi:hypothetical protein G9P44_005692 [Scheffersomyces stipitis]|nr:hypothetical protein G9P44_005692 [Scheffersomyces stipitis]